MIKIHYKYILLALLAVAIVVIPYGCGYHRATQSMQDQAVAAGVGVRYHELVDNTGKCKEGFRYEQRHNR